MNLRIGQGYDVHKIAEGDHIVLGGVRIDSPFSLEGHSDADVLLHAITDALLGAISEFIKFAMMQIRKKGYDIVNLDTTIMAQKPKISDHRSSIITRISQIMEIQPEHISIKATTTEGLGAIGRSEGIAATAIVLIERKEL